MITLSITVSRFIYLLFPNIQLYGYTTFIYSVVDGHNLFLLFAITCKAAVMINVYIFFFCMEVFSFFLRMYVGVEFCGHIVALCLYFEKRPDSSKTAAQFYFHTNNVLKFQFLYIFINRVYYLPFLVITTVGGR